MTNIGSVHSGLTGHGGKTVKVRSDASGFEAVNVSGGGTDWELASQGTIHATNYVDNDTTDHTSLSNIGTNSHAQIDTHVALTNAHIDWTAAGAGTIHTDNYIEGNGGGGGANVKSGTVSIVENESTTVTFATAFSATPVVTANVQDTGEFNNIQITAVSTTAVTLNMQKLGGGGAATYLVGWIATDAGDT